MKKTFLGIGSGPIQTGIFVRGASQGNFDRIVLADVNPEMIQSVRQSNSITVNTAGDRGIHSEIIERVEIYDPSDPEDLKTLIEVASEALVISTALPSTVFYTHVVPWLREAFANDVPRFVYTAENSTTAAEELEAAVGTFPQTAYLDTVIGKMCKVFKEEEVDLPTLAPGFGHGHLVEAYNEIYTGSSPLIEEVGIHGLYPKKNLEPFEAAKLYGHNTSHFLLGLMAEERGCTYMDELSSHPDIIASGVQTLVGECGVALNRKYGEEEDFVTPKVFTPFALNLISRMLNPYLRDSVARLIRDPERKLGWNDRMMGAIRLCHEQGVVPVSLYRCVAQCAVKYGKGMSEAYLQGLWGQNASDECHEIMKAIQQAS